MYLDAPQPVPYQTGTPRQPVSYPAAVRPHAHQAPHSGTVIILTSRRDTTKLAGNKRRSYPQQGKCSVAPRAPPKINPPAPGIGASPISPQSDLTSKASNSSPSSGVLRTTASSDPPPVVERKRRPSTVNRAVSSFISTARKSFAHFDSSEDTHTTFQSTSPPIPEHSVPKLRSFKHPQGDCTNAAGDSSPTANSTFRVGVTEDRNRKCRRTMEDTHAYIYNFLGQNPSSGVNGSSPQQNDQAETDNGYFAIFDGHAGTFAADWCGKKLHVILEEIMRKSPNTPVPELLDQTFTSVDQQLEKLPVKNSGCTAVTAVLRWEDRVASSNSATGSTTVKTDDNDTPTQNNVPKLPNASRQRVLYTANVGDARIVLCRSGKALRLSYDHKGRKRIANAGGLILNNRVNGVLAVTRALGDSYLKDLVTGHPYTTETVIQPEQDEFIILACDGLWDVCSDQEAVDLIRNVHDAQEASKMLVDHALARFSTDNLSCMVIRLDSSRSKADKAQNADLNLDTNVKPASGPDSVLNSARVTDADVYDMDDLDRQLARGGLSPSSPRAAR
ncbi:protein phosphatase 2C [Penicillium chermesinum]|nr:protein phosphatase 2C [Penicillium chermesinum]